MNIKTPLGRSAVTAMIFGGLVLVSSSCRKGPKALEAVAKPVAVIAPELKSNLIGTLPGAVYQSQADSPIHWQPWTRESLDRAKAANRLVFAVVVMPQQPAFQNILSALSANSGLVSEINENYVPVLIDGDASREIGLLTADLCAEIKIGLQLPLFVWMTPEGNPVAWIPVVNPEKNRIAELFNQSHSMVTRTWAEDSDYVMKNSALDNANRRTRIASRKNTKVMSEQPGDDTIRAIRQLYSLYDSYSHSFDETGGLFPAGALDMLSTAAVHPGLPPDLRKRCLETTRDLLQDLLPSAMFDPLDGGVFVSKRGSAWALPVFYRDCGGQSRAAMALFNAYRATGEPRALEKALGLISYAERTFATPEGLFSMGMTRQTDAAAWLWSVEEIEKELLPEDAAWWIKATGMKGLGNLPFESDPRREYFRSNSLGIGSSLAELAAAQGQTVEQFTPRFESVRKKLLNARNLRLGEIYRDMVPNAAVTFRMVSTYAEAFCATGDLAYRNKAVALLSKARDSFGDGPRLHLFAVDAPKSVGEGRAFLYGLALQAALDVAVTTSDEKWLMWSEDLATTAAELFTDSEFLKECPDDAKIIDLPVTDLVMLFDDSTAGLISFAECRLAEQRRPLVRTFSELATPLPTYAVERPILHTDLLQATLARQFRITIVPGADLSPEMKLAIERLPMRMIQRRPAKSEDQVPAGTVKILFANGKDRVVSSPDGFREAISPSS